jgi:LmbE family N-acetylglucosaminyl deacetylase
LPEPLSRTLVLVFSPHPDDETIAVGGTICRHRDQGDRVVIVFSTDGSESHAAVLGIHDDPPPARLAEIRRRESLEAAGALGVPQEDVIFLHQQDTQLARDFAALHAQIRNVFQRFPAPHTVYFPDPDRELNADHRATGKAVLLCAAELQAYPKLLKYVVWDADVEREFQFKNRMSDPVHIDDQEAIEQVDIACYHQHKLTAMSKHRTQVALFSTSQTRTVVPPWLMNKLERQKVESFRQHTLDCGREG